MEESVKKLSEKYNKSEIFMSLALKYTDEMGYNSEESSKLIEEFFKK